MAYTPFEDSLEYIEILQNRPNDEQGMTAENLKKQFDLGPQALSRYLNDTLLTELNAESDRLDQAIADIAQLEAGTVTDNSVYTAAIQDGAVTTGKIYDGDVTTVKLDDYAVTDIKLARDAVITDKILDGAVNEDKIAPLAVRSSHLGPGAVVAGKIGEGAVQEINIATGSVTPEKARGLQPTVAFNDNIGVAVADWDESTKRATVQADGVTASNNVVVSAYASTYPNYTYNWPMVRDCGVRCVGQGAGTLTFEYDTKPTNKVWFVAAIFNS